MLRIMLTFLALMNLAQAKKLERSLAMIKDDVRIVHAKELLGKNYKKSFVSRFENKIDLQKGLLKIVKKRLPKAYKKSAFEITSVIIDEAIKHELDPYFIMAVISGESSFNPSAIGPVGEIGLMQIRVTTGAWMAKMIKAPWSGKETLKDPVQNIRLGTAYLAWLREKFGNHGQLYLAAYNMGPRNVKNALGKKIWPKDYPRHVMKRYFALYKENR